MNGKLKFGILTAVIVVALGWLAADGINQAATYYVTLEELAAMEDPGAKRIRVGGDVVPNSIVRDAGRVDFTIIQNDTEQGEVHELKVSYTGNDPLPDTFRDNAQALCDGTLRADGVFEAKKIQAKCASKYEAEPGQGAEPVYDSAPEQSAT